MSRKSDRKHAFNLAFQLEFLKDDSPAQLFERYFAARTFDDPDASLPEGLDEVYVKKTFMGLAQSKEGLDAEIAELVQGWELSRMSKIDLTVLRLAVFEILYGLEIPPKVAVNEAVELAKVYSGDDSPGFVNGVLGQLIRNRGI